MSNPFDQIDPNATGPGKAAPPSVNPFDQIDPNATGPAEPSATGAFFRSAARSAIPAAGGLAAIGAGAEIGAGIGSIAGPIGAGIGGFVGGVGGMFASSAATQAAQDYAVSLLPAAWKDPIEKSAKEDEEQHGTATFLGGLLPVAATMNPFGAGAKGAAKLAANATAMQRIMASPYTARLFGGSVMGGMELGQEAVSGQPVDWQRVGMSTAFGVAFNRPNAIGEAIEGIGERPASAIVQGARDWARGPATYPKAPEAGATVAPQAAPPAKPAEAPKPPPPTIAQAQDAKVAGPGITEEVHTGAQKQNPTAEAQAQDQARLEQSLIGPEKKPDLHAVAERIAPETMAAYDEAIKHRDALEDWLDTHPNVPEDVVGRHFAEAQARIDELEPQVRAAYRHAAEAAGGETVPPAAAAPADGSTPAGGQDFVIRDPLGAKDDGETWPVHVLRGKDGKVDALLANGLVVKVAPAYKDLPTEQMIAETLGDHPQGAPADPSKVSPASAAKPVKPIAEQREFIVEDFVKRAMAGGAPEPVARANAEHLADRFITRAARFKGALGTAEELYLREGPRVTARGGVTVPAGEPKAPDQRFRDVKARGKKVKADEPAKPGDTVVVGNKELVAASEPHGDTQILVAKPDETGASQAFVKTGETIRPLPEKVDFAKVADVVEPKQAEKWREIGQNANGETVFEDDRGVRSIVTDGVRESESVRTAPDGTVARGERKARFEAEPKTVTLVPPAAEPEKPAQIARESKPAFGANNKIYTAERKAAGAARFAEKLREAKNQLNSGFDPEFIQLGIDQVGFYIEGGVRAFADVARELAKEFGVTIAEIKPHIRSWYLGAVTALEDAGVDVSGVDTQDVTRTELARLVKEEEANGDRTAIREPTPSPLGEEPAGGDEGNAGGGDSERIRPESIETDGGRGIQSDAERVAAARSGGDGEGGLLPATGTGGKAKGSRRGGGASSRAPRGKRSKAVADESNAGNPAFDQAPEIAQHETANVNIPASNFVLTDEMAIGRGTEGEKYDDNLAAIRTLKQIEAENRRATPGEKEILARYVGWGGLKNAFRVAGSAEGEGVAKGWEKRVAELEGMLTPKELRRARNSTGAAHYTSPTVVKAIWQAVKRLGFSGGSVLEPSVGSGNFFGFMPEDMRGGAKLFGAELDDLTARIAQKLYPAADILNTGFEKLPLPQNHFALAIGNPPFGSEGLHFRGNPAVNGHSIHNQFFLASLDGVRPGGLFSMVVSHNLMDALDRSARLKMAGKAKFIAAIRLPETTFKENARTQVVTDIIFLEKRADDSSRYPSNIKMTKKEEKEGTRSPFEDALRAVEFGPESVADDRRNTWAFREHYEEISQWVNSREIRDPSRATNDTINANDYFAKNPDRIIGQMDASGTMNPGRREEGKGELNVKLADPAEFEARLAEAIERLPQRDPRTEIAEASLKMHDKLVQGMKLAIERAEPGRIRLDEDGGMKTVIDVDPGAGRGKSRLQEIPLTADTPFRSDYVMNDDGKWQRVEDVLEPEQLGPDGKPLKVMGEDGKLHKVKRKAVKETKGVDAEGNPIFSNRNEKVVTVYEPADIPAGDKWGEERLQKAREILAINTAFKRQRMLEIDPEATDEQIEANRAELNRLYDAFVERHGVLHDSKNIGVATYMPDGGLALATEDHKVDKRTKTATTTKSAIMSKRTAKPPTPRDRVDNIGEAVAVSLGESGKIDLDRIAKLLGTDEAGAVKALSEGEAPRAFYDPETSQWEPRDAYLSGLVRKKLLAAKEAGLEANIAALEKVQPERWDASQVTPNIGSGWVPAKDYEDFLHYLGYNEAHVFYSPLSATFTVDFGGSAESKWDTMLPHSYSAGEIVERMMNSKPMVVRVKDDDGVRVLHDETTESQTKAGEIANEFLDWAFKDDARRELLLDVFNDKFNGRLLRQRDGSHLTLPGKNPDIVMRAHQMNAIWRGITDPAVLFDHVVGAGKTYAAIARIIERRRMGLSQKPLVVVPNHIIEAWGNDFKALYPGSNVLVASQADFERSNRRRLFARIAAGDYDAVVIGHSSFSFIDVDPSTEERYIEQGLAEARAAVEETKKAAVEAGMETEGFRKAMSVREAERLVTKLEQRLAKSREGKRDQLLTWEEMGIDDLTIDEAHEYKNLNYSSRLQNVVGMGNKNGSAKALDLNMKIRSLQERPGSSVAFLTGTPISNSASEMYLILKNLVPKELKALGLENFDAWRTLFVDYQSEFEPTEAGTLKEVQRLGSSWTNMRSLMDLYYSVADCVPIETIKENALKETGEKFPIPDVRSSREGGEDGRTVKRETPDDPVIAAIQTGGDREMVFTRATPEQLEILSGIVSDFHGLADIDNPIQRAAARLRLYDRARKISLDPRAIEPRATVTSEGGKLTAVADRASSIYHRTAGEKGTQLIFLDRSVPKSKGDDKIVKAYDKARDELRKAQADGDEAAESTAIDKLAEFNEGEVESLREALAGGWNAYDEIKRKLIARGVKPDEIRFVQEANNAKEKEALFDDVKAGKVRILLGSTPRMGAGTNVQRLLVALHHVDVTWKPSDIEQREGRIVRQGNIRFQKMLDDGVTPNPLYDPEFAVDVIAYAAERTIDAKMWALNSSKLKTINRIRKYDGAFTMEFEDEESASMAEAAALATGDPMMVERVTLQRDINKLEVQQRAFIRRQSGIHDALRSAQRDVSSAPEKIAANNAFADEIEAQMKPVRERAAQRSITIEGVTYHGKEEAAAAAKARIDEMKGGDANARFSIDIGGQKLTNINDVGNAIGDAFGVTDTEVEVGGKTHISVTRAAMDIAAQTQGRKLQSGESYTLDNITLNGIPVEIDVRLNRLVASETNKGHFDWKKEVTFSALDAKGRQMAGYNNEVGGEGVGWAAIAAGLNKLRDAMKPESFRHEAEYRAQQAEAAAKKIPDLAEEATKEWTKADELREKRDRLQAVSKELSSDGRRPMGDEEEGEEYEQRKFQTDTPEFKKWFGASKAVDGDGSPLVLYRGEHGIRDDKANGLTAPSVPRAGSKPSREEIGFREFHSRLGSLSFSGKETANVYASEPNNRIKDKLARAPRVTPVYLRIEKPVMDRPDDPYIEMTDVIKALGRKEATRIALKFSGDIENTNNWEEITKGLGKEYGEADVKSVLDEHPEMLDRMIFLAFPFVDDPVECAKLKAAGYDGAIHGGSGLDRDEPEYKVFSESQVKSAIGNSGAFDPSNPSILHQGESDAQGKIKITPGKPSVITLFEKADASTLAHELGHDYLDMLMRDGAHPAAPDDVKADSATVLKWLGAKDDPAKLTRAQHEKFADGFLQYLREGRAPSRGLAGVFEQFKTWLVSLYQAVTKLGSPINDDIRRVFDRMLAEDPQHTVIAPEKARGPTLAETHEADDKETPAGHHEAEARGDRVVSERDQAIEDHPPEVRSEHEAEVAKIEAERQAAEAEQQGPAGAAGAGAGPTGEAPAGAGAGGPLEHAGGEAGAVDAGSGGGAAGGAIERSGGEPVQQGADGEAGPQQRPGNQQSSGSGHPNPEPADVFTEPESKFVDKAGNIRLDNIEADTPLKDVLRDVADANEGFIGDRRGVVTDLQVIQGAYELLGRDPTFMERKKLGEAFSAEEIKAMEIICAQSSADVHRLSQQADKTGNEQDIIAFSLAIARHQMLQAKWSQGTAEAGRAERATRKLQELWDPTTSTIDQHLKGATGRDFYQMKKLAKLFSALGTPAQTSKLIDDMRKPGFGDMVLEYWINGLISGPTTHVTYMIGNTILSAVNAGPDTLAAAAIGALRGRSNRVRAGEIGARFSGLARGVVPGLEAAATSFQAGVTARLPSERTSFPMPFQKDVLYEAPQMRGDATYRDAAASAFGILRGVRDAMLSGGALLAAGGVKGEPLWGVRATGQGAIPDFTVKGVGVLPVGTLARVPSRFISAIHAFFRAANYSMEKSALAYRQAVEEGATDIAARTGELWQNPTDSMMRAAVKESTDLTLMGPGGDFTRALSRLTNTPIMGIKLFKFIDPFVHISSNIIQKTLLERTPMGILSPELRADLLGKNGEIAQDRAQARMLVGSAMAMGFGGLAASGYASGSGPSDPRHAAMWRLAGNQAHSVRVGDIWYDVHRLGPMGMLLSVSADMYEVAHLAEKGDMLKAGAALQHAITQNILDESFMRGPADLIKAVEDPGRYGESYLRNWASSFVPYSVGMAQLARAMDPYTRQAHTIMDEIRRKTPGMTSLATDTPLPRRDVWGEPMLNPDALGMRGLTAIYETQMSHDPVNLAMLALGIAPAGAPKTIRGVHLTEQQHDDFARLSGRMAKMRLDQIVRSPAFQQWPGHVRHDVIVETIRQSRETARGLMMMKNPSIMADATRARQERIKQEDEDLQ